MLAATVGIMTICLVVALLRLESRRWVQGLGFAALGLVIFQGALGGMRVLLDERTLAMLHGMTGPLFFALTVSLAVFTSRRWNSMSDSCAVERNQRSGDDRYVGRIRILATVTAVLAYLQIVLGAVLRHVPVDSQPAAFILAVRFHLFLAAVLTLHVAALVWSVMSGGSYARPLRGLACVARRPGHRSIGARRRHLGCEVLGAGVGERFCFDFKRRDSRWRLAADTHCHRACGDGLLAARYVRRFGALGALIANARPRRQTDASHEAGGGGMTRITVASGLEMSRSPSCAGMLARVADYIELTKPRIVALELVTVVVSMHLASPWSVEPWVLLHTVLGAALVAASAGAFNQWWEQASDALMVRTADRPLPTGRLTATQVIVFGAVTLFAGSIELLFCVGYLTAGVAMATWLVYVLAYTPLKTRSPLNTAVGAVSGSLPILIGWTATGAAIDMRALALVAVMFLWQFPHFMAIAWLYRADYFAAASGC